MGELPAGFMDELLAGFSTQRLLCKPPTSSLIAGAQRRLCKLPTSSVIAGAQRRLCKPPTNSVIAEAYMVVVLCTESVVCGLASHTSRSNSPVTHPSVLSPFRSSFCFFPLFSSRVLLSIVLVEVFADDQSLVKFSGEISGRASGEIDGRASGWIYGRASDWFF
ncbi:hypothetical protein F2Q69_00047471 [Brassica cretica]|uniref:Uncharacterized protein n=1 Tax=Brassica cretica TaxID=69181 RepID=A0A8S9PV10_BRACR|nr:hypothetical protein F2Q69_00047471 [Brassica cretica]